MFICTECKTKYENKPEYCECGNDTFEEVIEEQPKKENILKKNNISPIAILFFIVCMVLSVLVILFFPKTETAPESKTIEVKPVVNIPELDTFWIDSLPQTAQQIQNIQSEQKEQSVIQNIKEKFIKKPKQQQPQQPQKTKPQAQSPKQQKAQTAQQTTSQPQPAKPVVKQTVQKPSPKPSTSTIELTNYKVALRNKLFSNLDISAIQGKGKCGIEFSVDNNGKLINRNFTFFSDNKTVNDEVYKMLMRTPVFNPPPQGYNGELIKYTFEFDNGSFSISIVN